MRDLADLADLAELADWQSSKIKQDWQCERKSPQKVLVDIDSRTVAMEVGTR